MIRQKTLPLSLLFSFSCRYLFKNKRRKITNCRPPTIPTALLIPAHQSQHTHGRSNFSLQLLVGLITTVSISLSKTEASIDSKPILLSLSLLSLSLSVTDPQTQDNHQQSLNTTTYDRPIIMRYP